MKQSNDKQASQPLICLVTALPAETRALLDAYKLTQHASRHLRIWRSVKEELMLLETGMGKLNAAAATAAVLHTYPTIESVINIGIAGGPYPYGQATLAHHVLDRASSSRWYPHMPNVASFSSLVSASIETLDKPDNRYQSGTLFDMEAAGVFSAASGYLSSSQVHCIKVVSDNDEHPLEHIDKASVTQLLSSAMASISPVIETLQKTQFNTTKEQQAAIDSFVDTAIHSAHHTVNDRHQLEDLLNRHYNLSRHLPALPEHITSASQLRKHLQQRLEKLPFNYAAS